MDLPTLLHSLATQGLTLSIGEAPDTIAVAGPTATLTLEQQRALSEHKQTLLSMLAPPPTCFIPPSSLADEQFERNLKFRNDSMKSLFSNMEFFERLIDDIGTHCPESIAQVVLEPELQETPCRRCGSRQSYLAIIHDGHSLRRDCAKCGRFLDFPAWNEPELALGILSDTASGNRYNEKASRPSAGNTQASSDDSLSITKENANG